MATDVATTTPVERFAVGQFVELEKEKRDLEERLKQCKKDMATLQEQILDDWADQAMQSAKIGGFNVHIRNDFVCTKRGGVAMEDVCTALYTNGLGALVKDSYSAAALKSRIKEMAAEDQVPEDLGRLLRYETLPRLIAVKA